MNNIRIIILYYDVTRVYIAYYCVIRVYASILILRGFAARIIYCNIIKIPTKTHKFSVVAYLRLNRRGLFENTLATTDKCQGPFCVVYL